MVLHMVRVVVVEDQVVVAEVAITSMAKAAALTIISPSRPRPLTSTRPSHTQATTLLPRPSVLPIRLRTAMDLRKPLTRPLQSRPRTTIPTMPINPTLLLNTPSSLPTHRPSSTGSPTMPSLHHHSGMLKDIPHRRCRTGPRGHEEDTMIVGGPGWGLVRTEVMESSNHRLP